MPQLTLPRITLHNRKIDAVKRFHPWIFSGAIQKIEADVQDGDLVEVYSASGEYLATGFYGTSNIAVKVLSFQPVQDLDELLLEKVQRAFALRQQLNLTENPATNCYRLINAEGDGLPGLIVDWYNGVAVLQAYSQGVVAVRSPLVTALQKVYGDRLTAIYDKSGTVLPKAATPVENQYLFGTPPNLGTPGQNTGTPGQNQVSEYSHPFWVDWETGQKTGFFLDQRENRRLLAQFAAGKRVLNTFCYSGGFSVYALHAGATLVHSVDSSAKAIEWTQQNIALSIALSSGSTATAPNHEAAHQATHEAFACDVFSFLKDCDADYDVIVLDPPAFAKTLSARHSAVMAYKRLNQMAIAKLKPGGILFTFSCSQVVSPDLFNGAVTAAAIEMGRPTRILHHLFQPPDHPTSIFHPEGSYLKGLVVRVD